MYYTSYYSCPLLRQGNWYRIPISNSIPKGVLTDGCQLDMIPDWKTIVEPYKLGFIDEAEYRKRYLRQLEGARNFILIALRAYRNIAAKDGKDIVFLCYEKTGDFCHRHIFAEWLTEKTGEPVSELKELTLF